MSVLKHDTCPCLTQQMIEILNQNGIVSVTDLIHADIENLCVETKLSYKELLASKRYLSAHFSAFPINGADLYQDTLGNAAVLSTGFESLDALLDGGFYTSELTEIVGGPGVGKTQVCMRAALSVSEVTGGNVLYIDTNGSFCCQWLSEHLEDKEKMPEEIEEICKRINCVKIFDIFELLSFLLETRKKLSEQSSVFYEGLRLIVIDSVTAVISPVLGGKQNDGHGLMMHLAQTLKILAIEFSIAILITNNVVMGDGDQTKPALGKSWRGVPNTRLEISSSFLNDHMTREHERFCKITKSSRQQTGIGCSLYLGNEEPKNEQKENEIDMSMSMA